MATLNAAAAFSGFQPSDVGNAIYNLNNYVNCYGAPGCVYGVNVAQYPFNATNVLDFNVDGVYNTADYAAVKAYFTNSADAQMDADIVAQWYKSSQLLEIQNGLSRSIAQIKANVLALDGTIDTFKSKLVDVGNRIQTLKTGAAGQLVTSVLNLEGMDCGNGNCVFVQENYAEVSKALCGTIMTSLLLSGASLFLASLSVFIISFCLIFMAKRLAKWKAAVHIGKDIEVAAIS